MSVNGCKLLDIALNSFKWLELLEIAENGWKWLEMAGMTKMAENG